MVEEYLDALLPEDWDTMDLFARRNFLHGSEFGGSAHTGTVRRTSVTNMEIWCECFGRSQSDLKPTDSYALSTLMTKVKGWEKAGRKSGSIAACDQPIRAARLSQTLSHKLSQPGNPCKSRFSQKQWDRQDKYFYIERITFK